MGLGFPSIAAAHSLPVFDNMMQQKKLKKNLFSVFMSDVIFPFIIRKMAVKDLFNSERLIKNIWHPISHFSQLLVMHIGKLNLLKFKSEILIYKFVRL
jgi:hypothetical protein